MLLSFKFCPQSKHTEAKFSKSNKDNYFSAPLKFVTSGCQESKAVVKEMKLLCYTNTAGQERGVGAEAG